MASAPDPAQRAECVVPDGGYCQLISTAGDTEIECENEGEPVEMYDGGTVWLCRKHRSWAAAMGRRIDGSENG